MQVQKNMKWVSTTQVLNKAVTGRDAIYNYDLHYVVRPVTRRDDVTGTVNGGTLDVVTYKVPTLRVDGGYADDGRRSGR